MGAEKAAGGNEAVLAKLTDSLSLYVWGWSSFAGWLMSEAPWFAALAGVLHREPEPV